LNDLTVAEVINIVKNKTEYDEITLTCMGVPLPPNKTLEELEVRSGYFFRIDPDWESRMIAVEERARGLAKSSPIRPFLPGLFSMLREHEDGLKFTEDLLKRAKKIHLSASDVGQQKVLEIFGIALDRAVFTTPRVDHTVPDRTLTNLQDLLKAGYDNTNESYARLRMYTLMVPALIQARENAGIPYRPSPSFRSRLSADGTVTPVKRKRAHDSPRKDLKMFSEYELRTEIDDPELDMTYVLTGRADWAAGQWTRMLRLGLDLCRSQEA
jgi:hypothetical protein